MSAISYVIAGGDFEHAGAASRGLKDQLKRLGADAVAIRRAMIAAYEAEMNAVIHAGGGRLRATINDHRLDVEVSDDGPGIADIEQAMRPGFSTAPAAARELGFGAGMGLPNIKKNADFFAIESVVGRGTRVRFTIYLKPQETRAAGRHSVHVIAGSCSRCLECLHVCPTGALRVRPTGPEILEHLCIDCTACLGACPTGAIAMVGGAEGLEPSPGSVLVLPPAFLVQFGGSVEPERVLAALADMGFPEVWVTDVWEQALRSAVLDYARTESPVRPVLSPVCPAVVNLIETRFPSLLPHVAPLVPLMQTIREELTGRRGVFVVACPCERTVLEAGGAANVEILLPSRLRAAVLPRLMAGGGVPAAVSETASGPKGAASLEMGTSGGETQAVLRVTGIRHVLAMLEEVENGLMNDVPVLELFVCDEGCFGSPTLAENPFVARHRRGCPAGGAAVEGRAIRRRAPYAARPGLRLDGDMARAIEKLARIDALVRSLPGKDCGRCGAPTCAALAEDIVMGRAGGAVCVCLAGGER